MYLTKTPRFIKTLFPNFIWNMPNATNTIYLTFDDGPSEHVTLEVLDVLKANNVKATFFVLGTMIEKSDKAKVR